jgi:Tfp pilus assembly protein PilV
MDYFKNIKGMSLLEVAIALFLLAVGLLGLAGMQLVFLRGDTMGQQATLATTLAKEKLAELQGADPITAGADQYLDKGNGVTYAREWFVHQDMQQEAMHTVVVRVSWKGTLVDRCVTVKSVGLRT